MNKDPSQKNTGDSTTDQATEENDTTGTVPHRRIQDGITSKTPTRKMNLDRRGLNRERRSSNNDSDYKGPSRRYTIDRRVNIKDRRKSD